LFIEMQTDIQSVRDTAFDYLPYLAALPLIAVWSYLLDGLFIGATRAREMRNGMLLTVILIVPFGWALQSLGNHGLWITFLLFMLLRSLTLGAIALWLRNHDGWFAGRGH
jgi:MATE family multidrug resistance protein